MKYRRWFRLRSENSRAELEDELSFHEQMRVEELMRDGHDRPTAEQRARGDRERMEAYREPILAEDRRRVERASRLRVLDELGQDVRFGARQLLRDRSFALLAILTLALGIAANTTIFTVLDRLFLRALPFPADHELVSVQVTEDRVYSPWTAQQLAERTAAQLELAAWSGWGFTLTGAGTAEALNGAAVTTNLFDVLGTAPLIGRTLREEDRVPGQRVAVLSYGLWQRRFAGDPDILNRTLTLSGAQIPVVGVMPPEFSFPNREAELWLPITYEQPGVAPTGFGTEWVARLRPGVTAEAARSALANAALQIRAEHPIVGEDFGNAVILPPLRDGLVGQFKDAAWILFAAVTFLLLIACVNVANLLLTRAQARSRELAIRTALGARRTRLIRQLLTESLMLAFLAAIIGVILASYALRALLIWLPVEVTAFSDWSIDGRIIGYAVIAATTAVLLFGVAPALALPVDRAFESLKEAGRSLSGSRSRMRALRTLIGVEIALSVLLAIGAGLMLQSFWRLRTEDTGFDEARVLTLAVTGSKRAPDEKREFHRQLEESVRALPDVVAYGAIQILPLGGSNWNPPINVEGREPPPPGRETIVDWRAVTPGFFETMRIPILRGRNFTTADREDGEAVGLISETAARRVFAGEDPIGQRVWTGFEGEGNWVRIIGITGDMKDQSLQGDANPILFRPHRQMPINPMVLMVRTRTRPEMAVRTVEEVVRTLDPDAAIKNPQPLSTVVSDSIAQPRLLMILLTSFGVLAGALSAIGLFGVISYIVQQRRWEFSIRAALGADRANLLQLAWRQSLGTTIVGIAVGMAAAALLTQLLASQLYGISALHPLTYAAAALAVLLIASLATLPPARRAASARAANVLTN